ncbi:hypothetical protein QQF64_015261 [Cirrhinus molitorella]|uniref:Uncharacterized protein n=1 Tax=Cirrhinus molitorella TaxID=172907 RepID=A0ABR3NUF8_9TELE
MSSSDNFSSQRRNPPRNCRPISEANKPVSGDKASILHNKGTTVSQVLNLAESCGQGTTKKEKTQEANQNAPPDLLACLQKSTHQPKGQNGLVSSKSREVEPTVPQKITTPKCPSEKSKRGRKKKVTQPSEKEVAASKDNSEHNSCPEQHSSSLKTKGTCYGHSKKTQSDNQTPSDVLHTFTTLSPPHHKLTNGDCTSIPHTPKRGRPRKKPFLSSPPTSDPQPLSPKRATNSCKTNGNCSSIPHTPKRGRPPKKKSLISTPNSDPQPLSPKRATISCKTNGDCTSVPHTPKRGRPPKKNSLSSTPNSDPQPLSPKRATISCKTNGDCTSVPHTPKRGRPPRKPFLSSKPTSDPQPLSPKRATITCKTNGNCTSIPHTPKRGRPPKKTSVSSTLNSDPQPLSPKRATISCKTNGDCTSVPHTPKRGRPLKRPLLSSTPTSDLSPKRAKNSCIPHTQQNVKDSSLVKAPPTDGTPSRRGRPQRFTAAGRPRGRKKKNMAEQSIASPPVKHGRKSATSPLKSTQEEPSVETLPINKACFETKLPEPQESDQNISSDLSIELSLQEEPHPLNNYLFMEEEEDLDEDDEELPSFLQQDSKKPLSISEGLCVWCKLRKYPYWPAVVKSVNRKNKKASIVFIDCYVNDQKRIRKGFSVSLRTLKPFDCEEYEKLVEIAKEAYGNAITWSLELIADYRIRIGCGSFSGSFIEYCGADISFPVRRRYSEGTSVLTFPIQEMLGEQCDNSDNNIEDIGVEEQDELLSKKVLPDRSKAARNRANNQLVEFIIRRKVENRLLAVISGRESSKWMQALQRPSRPVVDVYLEDEEQVDKVYRYLNKVCESAPQINTCLENIQTDRIRLILDVLLPEAIIYAIAGVYKLSLEKAEEKYRRGPCFSNRERQEFDMMIEQQMKLKEITQRHRQ